jgi:hypothetical protein
LGIAPLIGRACEVLSRAFINRLVQPTMIIAGSYLTISACSSDSTETEAEMLLAGFDAQSGRNPSIFIAFVVDPTERCLSGPFSPNVPARQSTKQVT